MVAVEDEVPEIQYRYECVEGDARRFVRDGMALWPRRNRALWTVMAFESVVFIFLAWATRMPWFLLGIPALFLFFAALSYWNLLRNFRRVVAPGEILASGYGDRAFRLADGGVQLTLSYDRVESVVRRPGCLVVRLKKGRWLLIPAENAPAEAEARIRAGIGGAAES
ncbi:MAG: hypothetical protein QM809_01845 [Gordonia sp. (in: high G+C Gram-positive bacteria)]|uniref:hypothetical protein n=1 Tax=Gordonia sp. (in: high G+C Gram-positive bacteria) TaxID=84139 RepID=UPI0039E70190